MNRQYEDVAEVLLNEREIDEITTDLAQRISRAFEYSDQDYMLFICKVS